MFRSFLGHEDRELYGKLMEELPGIVNWAIEGYRSLEDRGKFIQPKSGEDTDDDGGTLESLSSPVKAFVKRCCTTKKPGDMEHEDFYATTDDLYRTYKFWCEQEGRSYPSTKEIFTRDLKSAFPGIQVKSRTVGVNGHASTKGF